MQFDAFTGGVEPGGLRSQSDILADCFERSFYHGKNPT